MLSNSIQVADGFLSDYVRAILYTGNKAVSITGTASTLLEFAVLWGVRDNASSHTSKPIVTNWEKPMKAKHRGLSVCITGSNGVIWQKLGVRTTSESDSLRKW